MNACRKLLVTAVYIEHTFISYLSLSQSSDLSRGVGDEVTAHYKYSDVAECALIATQIKFPVI